MRKIVVSESIAVDGIFDAETMGKWATPYFSEEREEFIRNLVLRSDALLLGRTTYDIQAWYWPHQQDDKYGIANHKNRMPKYVVTSNPLQAQWNNATVVQRNIAEEIARLKQQPGKDILIDEFKLLVHPAIAGSGKRFFRDEIGPTKLRLTESQPLSLGMVALSYEPTR